MPLVLACGSCGQRLAAPEAARGKSIRCPKCAAVTPVPLADALPAAVPAPAPTESPPAPRPPRRRAAPMLLAAAGGALLLVLGGMAGGAYALWCFFGIAPPAPEDGPPLALVMPPETKKVEIPTTQTEETKKPAPPTEVPRALSRKPRHVLGDLAEGIAGIACSADGKTLALGLTSGTIRFYDADTLKPTGAIAAGPSSTGLRSLTFLPGGRTLAVGDVKGGVALVERASKTRTPLPMPTKARGAAVRLELLADGKTLVSHHQAGFALWDLDTKTLRGDDPRGLSRELPTDQFAAAAPSGDGIACALIGMGVLNLKPGGGGFWPLQRPRGAKYPRDLGPVCYTPDGKLLAWVVCADPSQKWYTLWLYDVEAKELRRDLDLGFLAGTPTALAFSPDGATVAVALAAGELQLWDVATGRLRASLACEKNPRQIVFADAARLFVAATDRLSAWDVAHLPTPPAPPNDAPREVRPRAVALGHVAEITGITYTPDGKTIYTAAADGTLRRWKADELRDQPPERPRFPSGNPPPPRYRAIAAGSRDQVVLATSSVFSVRRFFEINRDGNVSREPAPRYPAVLPTAQFTPDGRRAAVLLGNGSVRLIDPSGAIRPLEVLPDGGARGMALAPDGESVVICCGDGKVRLFDTLSGKLLATMPGRADDGEALTLPYGPTALTPDGTRFVAQWGRGLFLVYSLAARAPLTPLKIDAPRYPVQQAAFAPDGRLLALAARDNAVHFYDLPTRSKRGVLTLGPTPSAGADAPMIGLAFSPDGKTLAVGGTGSLRLYDLAEVPLRKIDDLPIAKEDDTPAKKGPAAQGTNPRRPTQRHPTHLVKAIYARDGKTLYSASADGTIKWWDAVTLEAKGSLALPYTKVLGDFDVTPDEKTFAVAYAGSSRVLTVERKTGEKTTVSEDDKRGGSRPVQVRFSPDGTRLGVVLAAGDFASNCFLWNLDVEKRIYTAASGVEALRWTPENHAVAVCARNRLYLLDGKTGKTLWQTPGHPTAGENYSPSVNLLAVSADGRLTASVWRGTTLRRWSLETRTQLDAIEIDPFDRHSLRCMALHPDGRLLAIGGFRGFIEFWDLRAGKKRGVLKVTELAPGTFLPRINEVSFSPDGKTLVIAADRMPILWDVAELPLEPLDAVGKTPPETKKPPMPPQRASLVTNTVRLEGLIVRSITLPGGVSAGPGCWSADGAHCFLVTRDGPRSRLHRLRFEKGDFHADGTADLDGEIVQIHHSAEGLVLPGYSTKARQVTIVDPATLAVRRRIELPSKGRLVKLPGGAAFACAPALSFAVTTTLSGGLTRIDLKDGRVTTLPVKDAPPRLGFMALALLPDATHVVGAGGPYAPRVFRLRLEPTQAIIEESVPYPEPMTRGQIPVRLTLSPDGKLVAATPPISLDLRHARTPGDRRPEAMTFYSTAALAKPALSLPRWQNLLGFDADGRLYTLTAERTKLLVYPVPLTSDARPREMAWLSEQTSMILPHPRGAGVLAQALHAGRWQLIHVEAER